MPPASPASPSPFTSPKGQYGLDHLPFPGFFLTVYGQPDSNTGEDVILESYDTRPNMTFAPPGQCNRHTIVARLKELKADPRHIEAIASDLSPHPEQD
jgi:hypothetical protein